MVEGILEPIAQLFNWIFLGVVLVAVVKVIEVASKDPKLKQKIFSARKKPLAEPIIKPNPTVKRTISSSTTQKKSGRSKRSD